MNKISNWLGAVFISVLGFLTWMNLIFVIDALYRGKLGLHNAFNVVAIPLMLSFIISVIQDKASQAVFEEKWGSNDENIDKATEK